MANHATSPARSYGNGFVAGRGGFLPYGSTTSGAVLPVIPLVNYDPTLGGVQPRWGGFNAIVHDPVFVGRYNVLLDDDWLDLIVNPIVRTNLQYSAPTVFLPSATGGHGLTLFGLQAGPGALATVKVTSVIYEAASGSLSATNSGGQVQITPASGGSTNAAIAAYINAHSATLGVTASAGDTDLSPTGGAGPYYLTGGVNGMEEFTASAFVGSDTPGDGIQYTAVKSGVAGDAIRVVYVYSGTSAPAVAVSGNTITITIATSTGSTTNANIAAAVEASAPATALVYISKVVGLSDTNTTTTNNVSPGTELTGGGLVWAKLSGATVASANSMSAQSGLQYYTFNIAVYEGDTPVDLSAQTELFMPSTTAGNGVLIQSLQAPAQASGSVLSMSGAGNGVLFTMKQPGDAGNFSGVVYNNPLATLFIPSTTNGDGVLWTSQIAGLGGRGIQLAQTAPTGNAQIVVSVNGFSILIQPIVGSTNAQLVTAVAANPSAAALIIGTSTGSSDVVSATGNPPMNLGGGYSLASGTVTATQEANLQGGFTVFVNFGSAATNTEVVTAVNGIAGGSMTASVISSSGSDTVVATAFTPLTGGSDPADLSVTYTYVGTATPPTAAFSGTALTVTIRLAGDTNANVAAAINAAQNGVTPLMEATVVGSGSDNNLPPPTAQNSTNSWGPKSLVCHNQIELQMSLRNSDNGAV